MTVGPGEVRGRVTAALVVAVLGVAGCSAQGGAAAVVEGETIGIDELHRTTEELAPYLPGASPSSVLVLLVAEPTFARVAQRNGVGVSEQEARALLEQVADGAAQSGSAGPAPDFGPGAVDVARLTLLQQRLQELPGGAALLEEVTAALAGLDVEVNPRFGELDLAAGGITPVQHEWLVPPADAAP